MNHNVEREKLLCWIDMVSFSLVDITLYLDTHPQDQEAIEYFNNYSNMRNQAIREYTKLYGPLTLDMYHPDDCWTWNEMPMPWEGVRA